MPLSPAPPHPGSRRGRLVPIFAPKHHTHLPLLFTHTSRPASKPSHPQKQFKENLYRADAHHSGYPKSHTTAPPPRSSSSVQSSTCGMTLPLYSGSKSGGSAQSHIAWARSARGISGRCDIWRLAVKRVSLIPHHVPFCHLDRTFFHLPLELTRLVSCCKRASAGSSYAVLHPPFVFQVLSCPVFA